MNDIPVGKKPQFFLLLGIGLILFGTVTWPVWRWLWAQWWGNEYYSHGLLIVPVAGYLAWKRIAAKTAVSLPVRHHIWGLLIFAGSLWAYLSFLNQTAYYLAAFAMLGTVVGLIWLLWGSRQVKQLAFHLFFLTLMIPLPFIAQITLPLALFTGVCSGGLIQFFGLDVTVVGTSVQLPNANLVIGAQCSGISSMLALLALTLLAAYLLKGPLLGRLFLIVLAVPLAMLGNILRVSTLLAVARFWGTETAFVFYHDYSGIVTFLLIVSLIIPISRGLRCNTIQYELL